MTIDHNTLGMAKHTAKKYLSYKARTKKEITNKLEAEGFDIDIINQTIEILLHYNYINDEEYALSYINSRKNMGHHKLIFDLKIKGLEESLIKKALATRDESPIIQTIFDKKLKGALPKDIKEKQKIFNYLARRGFSFDDIESSYNEYKRGTKHND